MLEQIGRPRRVGLVVPDPVAKVSLVRFEQVPARAQDLDQLIRWQVRKAAPFPIEEAQVSYVPGLRAADGQEFVVVAGAARRRRRSTRSCARSAARTPGIVDLATFNVINAVLAGAGAPPGDWLLVNVAPDYTSIAILRGRASDLLPQPRAPTREGTLADLVHQTAMYYEDRLQGAGFSRVLLCRRRRRRAAAGGRRRADAPQPRGAAARRRSRRSIRGPPPR